MKKTYHKKEAQALMNDLGKKAQPFIFLIDFEMESIIIDTDYRNSTDLLYDINGINNGQSSLPKNYTYFESFPISFERYKNGFDQVKNEIQLGNSFLLNLTYPTKILTDIGLIDIFHSTAAKYKINLKDRFVCFSPEIFVKIQDGKISSFPMKGTIDASIPNAAEVILSDKKETAEHYTIVDLIRNDLSKVAKKVTVEKFRYIDRLTTDKKDLLQVSSEITGQLPESYEERIGDILFELLPAGSISGAPKAKTLEIIKAAEIGKRGYYTGICGLFDGRNLDSGVMIRFIENNNGDLIYKSGCGITSMSDVNTEYIEMIDKVYLPKKSANEHTNSRSKTTSSSGS